MTMVQGHMIMIHFPPSMIHNPVTVKNCLSHHLSGGTAPSKWFALQSQWSTLILQRPTVTSQSSTVFFNITHSQDTDSLFYHRYTVWLQWFTQLYIAQSQWSPDLFTFIRAYGSIKNTNFPTIISYSTMSKTYCFIIMVQSHIPCNNG